jgi:hypothetical protein
MDDMSRLVLDIEPQFEAEVAASDVGAHDVTRRVQP